VLECVEVCVYCFFGFGVVCDVVECVFVEFFFGCVFLVCEVNWLFGWLLCDVDRVLDY